MLTVYFVDDDILILEELKRIINWSSFGFEIVGCTTNPLLAADEIVKLEPTLVIADVQMDRLSGLELANKLHKIVSSKFVFLSAYDRFDYAVEAIKIGALRYIKKPIKKSNLIELINEIRSSKINDFNTLIFNKMTESIKYSEYEKNIKDLFESNILFPKNESYRIISIRNYGGSTNALNLIKKYSSVYQEMYDDGILMLVIVFSLNYHSFKKELYLSNTSIAISNEMQSYDNISAILKRTRICSKTKFLSQYTQIIEVKDTNYADELCKTIDTCESVYDFHQLILGLNDKLTKNNILICDIQRIYRCCIYGLFRLKITDYQEELINISAIDFYDNSTEMIKDFLNYFHNDDSSNKYSNEYIVEEIKNDIRERINERIPLSYYSEKYGYYNSYLSKIFKNVAGISFIEYVLNVKMDVAKFKIETEPKKQFKEIAIEVGYDDYYHFSKIFKKMCNCSPQEFREKCLQNDNKNTN